MEISVAVYIDDEVSQEHDSEIVDLSSFSSLEDFLKGTQELFNVDEFYDYDLVIVEVLDEKAEKVLEEFNVKADASLFRIKNELWDCLEHIKNNPDALYEFIYLKGISYTISTDFEQAFVGEYQSTEAFAKEYIEEDSEIPDILYGCIDYVRVWERSLRFDFDYSGGYIFRSL